MNENAQRISRLLRSCGDEYIKARARQRLRLSYKIEHKGKHKDGTYIGSSNLRRGGRPPLQGEPMRTPAVFCAVLFMGAIAWSADYLMEGADSGRSGWLRDDKSFNVNNVRNMQLLWKTKLDSVPREMHNLFPPLIATGVNTAAGKKEILIVAGISDDIFAVDAATGTQLWRKHFDNTWAPGGGGRSGGTLCPGGQLAVPVMADLGSGKYTVYAVS